MGREEERDIIRKEKKGNGIKEGKNGEQDTENTKMKEETTEEKQEFWEGGRQTHTHERKGIRCGKKGKNSDEEVERETGKECY